MSAARYRKKPVEVDAVRWDGTNMGEIAAMFPDDLKAITPMGRSGESLTIRTLEGNMTAARGDWIIRGVKGEPYPCKPDIFEATYELVEQAVGQQLAMDVVVNGWSYKIPATPATTLDQLVADALAKGNHTGRPASDWEVRDAAGVWLNPYSSKTLEELNLHRGGPDTRLFLNLKAGAGG
jgi:hypothetical protein